MLARIQRKGNPLALLVGMQTTAATLGNNIEVPQNVKNRTTLWPSNCTTRYLSQEYKNADSKGHMHSNVYSNSTSNSQIMEKSTNVHQMKINEDVVHTYAMEYYTVIKNNQLLPFATTWMELECVMLSKISQRKTNIWFHSWEFKKHNGCTSGKEK